MFVRTRRLRRILGGERRWLTRGPCRRPSHRLRYTIIALLCIGAVVWMVTLMQKNVVFFKTVNVAVADRAHDGTREFRIGGVGRSGNDPQHRRRRRLRADRRAA